MTRFDQLYQETLRRIYQEGSDVFSDRTGYHTKAIAGVNYELYPAQAFPLLTLRKIPLTLFCAEVVWMITGEKHAGFLQQFTKAWEPFLEEDGTMETAYGYRWRHHFGRDQLLDLVAHLHEEPTSRQGVVMMWDPSSDGLSREKKKNVPCPFCFTVNVIDEALNLHLIIRSNDMILGNPHDTAGFALLQAMLAQEFGCRVGKLTVSISHAHIYDNHFSQTEELLDRKDHVHEEVLCTLPERAFERALKADVDLVHELIDMFKEQYQPLPALKKMQIAL